MDIITIPTMRELLESRDGPCVSLYMATHRAGRETQQGPIRLGNLLDEARSRLETLGLRKPDIDALLEEADGLQRRELFWQHQEEGLAIFVSPGGTGTYRLPRSFEELVVVSDSFHVKPLWPVVSGSEELFYVLALSRNEVRLLWADRFRVGEVDLPEEIPHSLAQALWFDDPEKQLQYHGSSRAGQGRVVATFHGHGVPEEGDEAKLRSFLRAVDQGVTHLIDEDSPLVLAGVGELVGLLRQESDHRNLVDEAVVGNPDEMSADQLHQKALAAMEGRLARGVEDDAAAFSAGGDLAVSSLEDAVPAAVGGRMASIFVPVGVQSWGRIVSDTHEVESHDDWQPGDGDLFDLAASATWRNSGRVHAVDPEDVPGDGPLAALLRY